MMSSKFIKLEYNSCTDNTAVLTDLLLYSLKVWITQDRKNEQKTHFPPSYASTNTSHTFYTAHTISRTEWNIRVELHYN